MYRYDYHVNGTSKTFNCTPQYMRWLNDQAFKARNTDIPCTVMDIWMFYSELKHIFQMLDADEKEIVFRNLKEGDAFVLI